MNSGDKCNEIFQKNIYNYQDQCHHDGGNKAACATHDEEEEERCMLTYVRNSNNQLVHVWVQINQGNGLETVK